MQSIIEIKRIYEPISIEDGKRILVDRLWPRGISKQNANLDIWMKDVAPSTELRKQFNHKPELFDEFRIQYIEELHKDVEKLEKVNELLQILRNEKITLLYAAKDRENNHAVVLRDVLLKESVHEDKGLSGEG
ncbi:DUF488 domain-containing protein [Fredinandcohnia sp. 179-A 10B2 NHS]|uniref:DUF488 domain-containing protein n=1 Tax=Fredinandcohnia sp. 179-A 10B2 NHS TaxID=3235176 RepID=UPI00399F1001